jgi:hypothetical protein
MNRDRRSVGRPVGGKQATPEQNRDNAIADAAIAFKELCDATTEAIEMLTEEFRQELEEKRAK